jgi:glutaredoxin
MKKILMFELAYCPYCREAKRFMEEILAEHPEYAAIEVEHVDEGRERARAMKFDYYYVPTYYVDGVKVHEGASTKSAVEAVYRQAFEE